MNTAKQEWTVDIPMKFTAEDIENIIVGAVEGGINHWVSQLGNVAQNTPAGIALKGKPEGEPTSEFLASMVLSGSHFWIKDDEGMLYTLDIVKLLEGIRLNHTTRTWSSPDNYDAEDYDCIIQCAIYGKIVWG